MHLDKYRQITDRQELLLLFNYYIILLRNFRFFIN